MEKIKVMIKIFLGLVITLSVVLTTVLYCESEKTEKLYQDSLKYVKNGQWEDAIKSIEQIPNYKDVSELYVFAYPNSLFNKSYANEEEKTKAFNGIISYIEDQKDKLSGENSGKYRGELLELEKTIRFKLAVQSIKDQNDLAVRGLDECASLIKQVDLINARDKLNALGDSIINRVDKYQLLEYVNLLNAIGLKDEEAILKTISNLDPNYDGVLAGDIKAAVQPYADIIAWSDLYASVKARLNMIQIKPGAERAYVILKLGNPQKIIKISSSYGDFEELIYENGTHAYMENGILYAIK